jgi:hypothetical protein
LTIHSICAASASKGVRHLVPIRMMIVDAANAGDDVTEAPLSYVGADASTAHHAAACSSQVVQSVAGYPASRIELAFELREAGDWTRAIGRENVRSDARQPRQHRLC